MGVNSSHIVTFILCLIASAFFSASETALTSLSESKTRQLIEARVTGSRALTLWLRYPIRVLTTLLVGNNVVNTLCAAIATVIAQQTFGIGAISVATGTVTLALLIFGEITPKALARSNAQVFGPIALTLLVPFYFILLPIVICLSWFAAAMVKLSGGAAGAHGPIATEEDIAYLIRLSHQQGVLPREEGRMLESVMEFGDTVVKEVMVSRTKISGFEKDDTLDEVTKAIREYEHSRWPVYEENLDNIVGVFCAKDLLTREKQEVFHLNYYIRPALFVPDSMKVRDLLKEFRLGKAHLAIVVDEYGGTAGIITLEDVIEEIVGEIRDEYDDEEEERIFKRLEHGRFLINGRVSVYDLKEHLNLHIPQTEHYDSLGGFLIAQYGNLPPKGAEIEYDGWLFTVESADEKRVITVLANKLEESQIVEKDKTGKDS